MANEQRIAIRKVSSSAECNENRFLETQAFDESFKNEYNNV